MDGQWCTERPGGVKKAAVWGDKLPYSHCKQTANNGENKVALYSCACSCLKQLTSIVSQDLYSISIKASPQSVTIPQRSIPAPHYRTFTITWQWCLSFCRSGSPVSVYVCILIKESVWSVEVDWLPRDEWTSTAVDTDWLVPSDAGSASLLCDTDWLSRGLLHNHSLYRLKPPWRSMPDSRCPSKLWNRK